MQTAYTARQIFTGINLLQHHAVIVEGDRIHSVIPTVSVPKGVPVNDLGDSVIAPPFLDLQMYGASGRLLSAFPDIETLEAIELHNRKSGTQYCLPTVATNTYEAIFRCIDAIRDYWKAGKRGIAGLHVEGPWIAPKRRGAHIEEWIFSPTQEQARELLEYGKGVIKIITLAPEACSPEIIPLVRSYDVIVSAGHSDATFDQANQAFEAGAETVTHLFNAMSPLHHRAPGLPAATMLAREAKASIIPDGYHLDYAMITLAKKAMGERLFIITDAVTETSIGPYQHYLAGDKYEAAGILSGSALTMNKAARNLVMHADIPLPEALRMCSLYPARMLAYSDEAFLLKAGFPAAFIVLDKESFDVKGVMFENGTYQPT